MKIDQHDESTDEEWLTAVAVSLERRKSYDAILREEELKIRAEAKPGTLVLNITDEQS
jgi:hypothetical protein